MSRAKILVPAALALLGLLSCAQPPSTGESAAVNDEFRTWKEYGGGPSQAQYSSLDQINTGNVSQLELAWSYDSGDLATTDLGYHESRRLHHTPIIFGGKLFGVSPSLRVFALDAASGEMIWERPSPIREGEASMGGVFIRGLMQWQEQRIYYTAGTFLYALDAETGEPLMSFGDEGRVDLREGLGRDVENAGISATSPGVVFEDLLILGSALSETLPAPPGDVRAFNVHTGELVWSFHTIPHPGEFGYDTWPEDAWQYSGGANSWAGMSLDRERATVFFSTGSAADDFYGANRVGDNLFANSVVALDARTGERRWHFQVVKHDVWDRDLPAPPALITVNRDGQPVDAVAQITKSGHVFLLNRDTGESLFPLEEVEITASGVPGEVLPKTQVLPTVPKPFSRQVWDESTITTRTPEANAYVREQLKEMDYGGQFIPPSTRAQVVWPGFDGGGEWGGPAYDPESSLLYVNANEMAWLLKLEEKYPLPAGAHASDVYASLCAACHGPNGEGAGEFPPLTNLAERLSHTDITEQLRTGLGRMPSFEPFLDWKGRDAMARFLLNGTDEPIESALGADSPLFLRFRIAGYPVFKDHEGYPANSTPWGTLSAINMDTGEFAWQIPLGEYPELVEQGLKDTGSQNYGGPVVTAGGLVFIAATLYDNKIRAFNKRNGELLWEYVLPAAGSATPSVYEADGRQFVVISAG